MRIAAITTAVAISAALLTGCGESTDECEAAGSANRIELASFDTGKGGGGRGGSSGSRSGSRSGGSKSGSKSKPGSKSGGSKSGSHRKDFHYDDEDCD